MPILNFLYFYILRCGSVAWHPDVATQMCIASEDDKSPVIQLWDLRLASSPLRVLERHSRGVLGVSWCDSDSDLLMSCGKDNRIYCWNPNSNVPGGEVVCELSSNNDGCWSFDISWCRRNPAVIATSSFDGKVSVYSLLGGQQQIQQSKTSAAIADSFPGMESMQPLSQPVSSSTSAVSTANQLKVAPKWMRKPCGAKFGFGGKLVTFDFDVLNAPNQAANSAQASQNVVEKRSSVYMSKVVTEPDLVQKSLQLETSLKHENLAEFCELKIAESTTKEDQQIWKFIRANFSDNPNYEFLELLGYNPEKIRSHISSVSGMLPANALSLHGDIPNSAEEKNMENLTEEIANLSTSAGNESHDRDQNAIFDQIAEQAQEDEINRKPFVICTENNGQGMLSKALLTKNLELAVDLCLKQNRFADALILAMQGGAELFQNTQQKYFSKCASEEDSELPLIEAVVSSDWSNVIERCDAGKNWCESLVAALTYKGGNIQEGTVTSPELEQLCCRLGNRLLEVGNLDAKHQALICFICAGSLENVVKCWIDTRKKSSTPSKSDIQLLQDLVEVVMLLKKAISRLGKGHVQLGSSATDEELSKKLTDYASQLASQGALEAAMTYLGDTQEGNESYLVTSLRERVQGALGLNRTSQGRGRSTMSSSSVGKGPQGYGYSAQQNVSKAGGWSHPGNASVPTYQGSMNAPYSGGIHNPVFDDLSTFNTPVPHSDAGGITNRRNSRPRNPSVEAYPPPTNTFQGSGSYVPPPNFQNDSSSNSFRAAQNVGTFNPSDANISSQPPVNIFTPDFSKQAAHLPPTRNANSENENNFVGSGNMSYPGKPPVSSGPGWNDPPPIQSTVSKPKTGTTTVPAPIAAPITQPLMQAPGAPFVSDVQSSVGGLPPPPMNNQYNNQGGNIPMNPPANNFGQHTQAPAFHGYEPVNQSSHQSTPAIFNPMQQLGPQQSMDLMAPQQQMGPSPSNFMTPSQGNVNTFSPQPNQSQPEGRPHSRLQQEEPKPKLPIPSEHQVLHDVFDGLKIRCLAAASHPVSKKSCLILFSDKIIFKLLKFQKKLNLNTLYYFSKQEENLKMLAKNWKFCTTNFEKIR